MIFWKSRLKSWQNKSITVKHGAGISFLFFLMVIIAATGLVSLYFVQKADDAIRINTEIQRIILEMDRELEFARRLHAEFFLYYPKIGLQKAHEDYAQPSIRTTARVVTISQTLNDMINRPMVADVFKNSRIDLNLYLSSAKRFADTSIASFELVTRLAANDNGLEKLMEKHIRNLESKTNRQPHLSDEVEKMKDLINRYRIKRERYLMQSAFNIAFRLRENTNADPDLTTGQKRKILTLIKELEGTARQILKIDVAIDSKFKDFLLQENATVSVSEKLIDRAKTCVIKAQQKISFVQHAAAVILISITLCGLIAAGIISHLLNISITKRIVQLTRAAGKMRKGHLEVQADQSGLDELGLLGKTFNFMAARLRGLVDNLEDKVRERTHQLHEANKSLQVEIRERKHAEEVIKQKEAFLNRVIEQSAFATCISDPEGTLLKANQTLKKTLNVTDEQIVGKYNILKDPLLKKQNLIPLIRTVFEKGKSIQFTCDWDGNDIPTIDLKGSKAVTIEATMFPVFDANGKLVNAVLNWIDITEKKKMSLEKQNLEQQLRQSHKMEAIGTLAAGIAHDFNNILAIMLGNTELALSLLDEDNPASESLDEIKKAGLRAKGVVRQLLRYSRKTEQHQTTQELGAIVKESLKLLRASIPSSIQIIEDIKDEKYMIRADATQIHQVVINLSANAAHAMERKGGILGIRLADIHLDESRPGRYQNLQPGSYVQLEVTDTGCGMPSEVIEKIFDPYYTTKAFGKGTGMGLSVVHGILTAHNAKIHVESEINKGTSFFIFFPKLEKIEKENSQEKIEIPLQGTERILFVDDEEAIVSSMSRLLTHLGYWVDGETSPIEAIETFKMNPDNIDLLITDMTMPRMDGAELAKTLKQIKPDLPVIVCSGRNDAMDSEKAADLNADALMMKPVVLADMAQKIRAVLNRLDQPLQ